MIATLPPLWRDADAYAQVTQNPLVSTFWGHAPAYCYIAKVPLFAGEQWERWRRDAPAVLAPQSSRPRLTDSGIWLLIIGQHLALSGAAFYFIVAVTRFFWVRLALALIWASNALFYTFAHCVGSETLGLIFVILLVAKALRLVRSGAEPRWKDWYVFAIGLFFCLLARHVNLWLILLLPATFLITWALHRISSPFASGERQRGWLRKRAARHLRQAVIAAAIGIACFAFAKSVTENLARKTRFHPHSRIGFTFLWRLQFLSDLSPESRSALLRKVADRSHSMEARKLITLLGQIHEEGAGLQSGPFIQRAIPLLFPPGKVVPWEKLDGALNQMAFAFLWPPASELLHVARRDFVAAVKMPLTEISAYLFATTAYYFDHKEAMPACAELVTFRGDANADKIWQLQFRYPYFRLWQGLTYNGALLFWFMTLAVSVAVARRKKINVRAITAFGITLTSVGLLMIASTCLLGEFSPRYGLPMWQLLLLSVYLLAGKTADLLALSRSKTQSLRN